MAQRVRYRRGAGVLIAWAALPRGDSGGAPEPQPLLDFRPVHANRDVLALIVGYAAAIWGCVGLRQWIVVFLTVQGNFSNLTSGVLAVAAPRYLGATIGIYSCIGFGASFLGTLLFGVTLDQFGGTSEVTAWILSFATCGFACLAGAAATIFLPRNIWQR